MTKGGLAWVAGPPFVFLARATHLLAQGGMVELLDRLLPGAPLVEIDEVVIDAPAQAVWAAVRHGSIGGAGFVRLLFALRTIPERLLGHGDDLRLRIDEMRSSPERPGFQLLLEEPGREAAVGAIGKVWRARIPFLHVDAAAWEAFAEPGWVKVAWALRVTRHEGGSRLAIEARVDATDDLSWLRFRRYFRVIGPFSRAIRRSLLRGVARELEGGARLRA